MATIQLQALRRRVRQRADMVYSQFVTDSELNDYINGSAQELYDKLVEANVDYYNATLNFTGGSGRSSYTLPSATVYKLRGLDIDLGGSWVPVYSFEYLERDRYQDTTVARLVASVKYRWMGTAIEFLPADHAAGTYRLRYVPLFVPMTRDTDTFDGHNGFEEYIVTDAAIKCKDKEESSVSVLQESKRLLTKRIEAMANVRDYGNADKVQDVRREQSGILSVR